MKKAFIINHLYAVRPASGEITHLPSGETTRMEPRIIRLLNLLVVNQGQVVSRDTIVKEIWQDYPGGNEGLSQAISFLRKILQDENKAIIRTIPKSGYSFHGVIAEEGVESQPTAPVKKGKISWLLAASVFFALLFGTLYFVNTSNNKEEWKAEQERLKELSRIDSLQQAAKLNSYR